MKQDTAVKQALDSIQKVIEKNLDGNTVILDPWKIVEDHLYMLYGVGFDEGRVYYQHRKPIACYKEGKMVCKYDSLHDASRYLKIGRQAISKALVTGGKCKGMTWQYLNRKGGRLTTSPT
jgi:hypothetical protein